jgi:hypothetical protein
VGSAAGFRHPPGANRVGFFFFDTFLPAFESRGGILTTTPAFAG